MSKLKCSADHESNSTSIFAEMEPAILDDPILLLKWFESNESVLETPLIEDSQPILVSTRRPRTHKDCHAKKTPDLHLEDIISLEDYQGSGFPAENNRNTEERPAPQSDANVPQETVQLTSTASPCLGVPFSAEQFIELLQTVNEALSNQIKNIDKQGIPIIAEAYRAYLTEKLKKTPEQAIGESIRKLLFIIRSFETYNSLSNYAKHLGEHRNNLIAPAVPSESIASISDNLLQQGITPGWLYLHGLNTIDDESDSSQLVDTSTFSYKKIKNGIRIDAVRSEGRILIPDFIDGLPVIKIGCSAFKGKKNITSVILPKKLIEIEEGAFEKSGICSIFIPDSVERIGKYAFQDCKKLKDVTLPRMLKAIKWNTFYGCSAIKAIKIPANVTTISDSAFSGCTKLKMVQIPNSVTRMESYIFSSRPVFYCNNGSRAYRYTEERWNWPKPKAFDEYDVDYRCLSKK